jgi:DNA topoisomerase-6 subunit B
MEPKIAEELAKELKEISVAEFFEKNRHLLGYDNPTKALVTVVKECVDNSLDACEEARILPSIYVSIKQTGEKNFLVTVKDNGPGIVEEKLPFAFGKLLYGSKFHRLRQARGTQGIGISGAILYAQLTTGKPAKIISSTGKKIHIFELLIDVIRNQPHIVSHKVEKNKDKWHGVKIELEIEGRYIERAQSVMEYLRQTAIMNPYAEIVYEMPNNRKVHFSRVVNQLPKLPKEIKPHPYGVELGIFRRMVHSTKAKTVVAFFRKDFSRVGKTSAIEICKLAKIDPKKDPHQLTHDDIVRLHKAIQSVKLVSPPTNCLSPIGEELILEGLKKEIDAEFFTAVTRTPSVYRGRPFTVECGIAYGGSLNPNQTAKVLRFANKVPLLYHQGSCAITKAIIDTDWRRYGLQQPSGSLPIGPIVILVHFVSVWVPFTSEGKQAIASYPEITKEIRLALQDAGRNLRKYISKRRRLHEMRLRESLFEKYIPEVAETISKISEVKKEIIINGLEKFLRKSKKVKK